MENRVVKYNLNAKKAYEFAGGFREVIPGKDRTKRIYGNKSGRPSYNSSKIKELNAEEQLVFLEKIEYGYRYSVKLINKRLDSSVEDKFLQKAESAEDIKYVLEYCKHFELAIPTSLHNRILMQTAMPTDKSGMRWKDRYEIEKSERKQKRYLKTFQEQKKSFKIILSGIMRENNLTENNTIKELCDSLS